MNLEHTAKWIRAYGDSPQEIAWRRSWDVAEYLWAIDIKTAVLLGTVSLGEWTPLVVDSDTILSMVNKELEKTGDTKMVVLAHQILETGTARVLIEVLVKDGGQVEFRNPKPHPTI